jgi:hypothetical protein
MNSKKTLSLAAMALAILQLGLVHASQAADSQPDEPSLEHQIAQLDDQEINSLLRGPAAAPTGPMCVTKEASKSSQVGACKVSQKEISKPHVAVRSQQRLKPFEESNAEYASPEMPDGTPFMALPVGQSLFRAD